MTTDESSIPGTSTSTNSYSIACRNRNDPLYPSRFDFKNLSLTSNGKAADKSQHLVVCFGEMLIDFVPTVSGVSLAEAPAFQKAPGGAPANVAVCVSKLGGSSAFIGKVGDDEFGRMLDGILEQHKVDNSGVRFDQNARTALAFVTLTAEGEREFLFFRNPSADMLLHESELDIDLINKSVIFHYGSISLIGEPCRSTHLAAMAAAKKSGSLLSYDPNLRLPLWPSEEAARSGIMSIWDEAHIIKEFKGRVNSIEVKAVDTTGAGDSFVGGLLTNLASDINLYQDERRLREALFFANACAALTVTQRGAIPALPTKDAISRFISEASVTNHG
ncbi:hypothetical protein DM860_010893 [Cuscuta australis]|uniref:Carbohydrate kinase PfkB domain-containing protein n=1 Tax=Cuscuta australis TaxID=267555 RepID=A0A328E4N6_9ASTE|nr:hypothetical protein DM860_010893 [Cuscuta australis]